MLNSLLKSTGIESVNLGYISGLQSPTLTSKTLEVVCTGGVEVGGRTWRSQCHGHLGQVSYLDGVLRVPKGWGGLLSSKF